MLFLILFLCTPPPSASRCHVTFRPRGQAAPVRGAGAGSGRRRGRPPLGQARRPPCRPRRVCSASARRAEPHARPLATRFSAQAWAWRSGAGSRVLCHPPERVPTPPGGWASAGSERVRLWALPACLAGERATVLPAPWGVLGAPEVPVAFPGGSAAAASTGDFPPRQGLSLSAEWRPCPAYRRAVATGTARLVAGERVADSRPLPARPLPPNRARPGFETLPVHEF